MEIESLGNNWYALYTSKSYLEYNVSPNPYASLHADRNPSACVYRHIDGNKVVACFENIEKSFMYGDLSYEGAMEAAMKHIETLVGYKDKQVDIFS